MKEWNELSGTIVQGVTRGLQQRCLPGFPTNQKQVGVWAFWLSEVWGAQRVLRLRSGRVLISGLALCFRSRESRNSTGAAGNDHGSKYANMLMTMIAPSFIYARCQPIARLLSSDASDKKSVILCLAFGLHAVSSCHETLGREVLSFYSRHIR